MTKKEKDEIRYLSLNTVFIIAVVCLVTGFLGGIVYNTYKSSPGESAQQASFPSTTPGQPGVSIQQANRILALEMEVTTNPDNSDAWLQLGNLYFDTGKHQKAIIAYKKYIEFIPDNPNVWTDLGVMYRRNGQPNDAIAAFEKALGLDPRHEQSRYNKGVVLLHDLNNLEEAVQSWKELAEINPDFITPDGRSILEMVKIQQDVSRK